MKKDISDIVDTYDFGDDVSIEKDAIDTNGTSHRLVKNSDADIIRSKGYARGTMGGTGCVKDTVASKSYDICTIGGTIHNISTCRMM